jgi:predicted MFS family arabinose efflux permease
MPGPRPDAQARTGYRELLAVREFRFVWYAHLQSQLGNRIAQVALAILVFEATGSATLTALTYALTFLPPLVAAPLLSGLADRFPRRTVLVVTDLLRAVLVGAMAIPGLPAAAVAALLVPVVMVEPVFAAARTALLAQILDGERYVVGLGLNAVTDQAAQIAAFALGGGLVGLFGTSAVLGMDAVTFVLSALLIGFGVRDRPAARPEGGTLLRSAASAAGLIRRDPRLRSLVLLAWLYGLYVAPEGLAAPYAHEIGAGPAAVGLLMAAGPLGAVAGALVLTRWLPPVVRSRSIGALAVVTGLPLVLGAVTPWLLPVLVGWTLAGAFGAYVIVAQAAFVRLVPDAQRGQALGLAAAGLLTAQGLGIALSGRLADLTSPSAAVALFAAAGALLAVVPALTWTRHGAVAGV